MTEIDTMRKSTKLYTLGLVIDLFSSNKKVTFKQKSFTKNEETKDFYDSIVKNEIHYVKEDNLIMCVSKYKDIKINKMRMLNFAKEYLTKLEISFAKTERKTFKI